MTKTARFGAKSVRFAQVMSSFNFLEDEVSEVERAEKDLAQLDRQRGGL